MFEDDARPTAEAVPALLKEVEALREHLVATDNEKCEARTRAATLERECKQIQEQMWDVKNKAASQAATVANMLGDLEAREAQCEADFAQLRSMNDKLQDREHELMREKMKAGSSGSNLQCMLPATKNHRNGFSS